MKRSIGFLVAGLAALILVWPLPSVASERYPTGTWFGEYYDSRWPLAEPRLTRHDLEINFEWGTGSPDPVIPADDFAVRWTRTADFEGGGYRFWAVHDDGLKVWVDEQVIIDQWYDQPAYLEWTTLEPVGGVTTTVYHKEPIVHYGDVQLASGSHRVKVEYYEHGKNAVIELGWSPVQVDSSPDSRAPFGDSDACSTQHVVRVGEWLYKIARIYGVTVNSIIEANDLSSARLSPGQVLTIPKPACAATSGGTGGADSAAFSDCRAIHVVQPGDNLYRIALKYQVSFAALLQRNDITYSDYIIHVGQELCIP